MKVEHQLVLTETSKKLEEASDLKIAEMNGMMKVIQSQANEI